jgi:transcriptional regulator with XRE-family HTH domain
MNMANKKKQTGAVDILYKRYIGDDPDRQASLRQERINAEVARTIYELRKGSGLTQTDLAKLIDTTQSVISRLEDADYDGHSLSLLSRIAKALNQRLQVLISPEDPKVKQLRYVFSDFVQRLRKERGLTIDDFSKKSGIDREAAVAMERDPTHRPSPMNIHKLSTFYKLPVRKVSVLAGAVKEVPEEMREQVARFAAQCESFSKLTRQEKHTLAEFVKFLRSEDAPR